jgi:hypothetical protein
MSFHVVFILMFSWNDWTEFVVERKAVPLQLGSIFQKYSKFALRFFVEAQNPEWR